MCDFVLCRGGIGGQLLLDQCTLSQAKLRQSVKFSIPHDLLCGFTHNICHNLRCKVFELGVAAMASLHEGESPAI